MTALKISNMPPYVYFNQFWKEDHLFPSTLEELSQYSVYLYMNFSGTFDLSFILSIVL